MEDAPHCSTGLAARIGQVVGIGLLSGLGFVLPMAVMLLVRDESRRTVPLVVALAAAVLLIRLLGRRLHRLLDGTERSHRFPLLVLYGVAAMLPPISLLLLPVR